MDSTSNIFIIFIIILFIFFTSMDDDLNKYIERKSYTFLFLVLIVAFIYQKIHLGWLLVIIFVFLYLNMDLTKKIGPKLKKFMNKLKQKINQLNGEKPTKQHNNQKKTEEHFSVDGTEDDVEAYEVKPYIANQLEQVVSTLPIQQATQNSSQQVVNEEKPIQEPFKLNVQEIKEMYENIKNQLSELEKKN